MVLRSVIFLVGARATKATTLVRSLTAARQTWDPSLLYTLEYRICAIFLRDFHTIPVSGQPQFALLQLQKPGLLHGRRSGLGQQRYITHDKYVYLHLFCPCASFCGV